MIDVMTQLRRKNKYKIRAVVLGVSGWEDVSEWVGWEGGRLYQPATISFPSPELFLHFGGKYLR